MASRTPFFLFGFLQCQNPKARSREKESAVGWFPSEGPCIPDAGTVPRAFLNHLLSPLLILPVIVPCFKTDGEKLPCSLLSLCFQWPMVEVIGARRVSFCSSAGEGTGGETERGRDTHAPHLQLLAAPLTFATGPSNSVFDGIAFPKGLEHTDTT